MLCCVTYSVSFAGVSIIFSSRSLSLSSAESLQCTYPSRYKCSECNGVTGRDRGARDQPPTERVNCGDVQLVENSWIRRSATSRLPQNGSTKSMRSELSRIRLSELFVVGAGAVESRQHSGEPGAINTVGEGVEGSERALTDASLVRARQPDKCARIGELYPQNRGISVVIAVHYVGRVKLVSVGCSLRRVFPLFVLTAYVCDNISLFANGLLCQQRERILFVFRRDA